VHAAVIVRFLIRLENHRFFWDQDFERVAVLSALLVSRGCAFARNPDALFGGVRLTRTELVRQENSLLLSRIMYVEVQLLGRQVVLAGHVSDGPVDLANGELDAPVFKVEVVVSLVCRLYILLLSDYFDCLVLGA